MKMSVDEAGNMGNDGGASTTGNMASSMSQGMKQQKAAAVIGGAVPKGDAMDVAGGVPAKDEVSVDTKAIVASIDIIAEDEEDPIAAVETEPAVSAAVAVGRTVKLFREFAILP